MTGIHLRIPSTHLVFRGPVYWECCSFCLELNSGTVVLREVIRQEMVAVRFHRSQNGAIQAGVLDLQNEMMSVVC